MKRVAMVTLISSAVLGLAACHRIEHADLQAELRELTKDAKGKVDPLPQMKPYEPVAYTAFSEADPFGPAKIKLLNPAPDKIGGDNKFAPDTNRPKQPLEAFPLESLKMVGTLTQNKQTWALVKADQGIFRVQTGNYMGQNFGVITKITEGEIGLKELLQEGDGNWVERVSSVVLQETEAKK
ncbi:MAG: pilus assembly protein PilP [Burkholderiales bacterium]